MQTSTYSSTAIFLCAKKKKKKKKKELVFSSNTVWWKTWSVENEECGKRGVPECRSAGVLRKKWKTRSYEL